LIKTTSIHPFSQSLFQILAICAELSARRTARITPLLELAYADKNSTSAGKRGENTMYPELSHRLKTALGLGSSPVAIAFSTEPPAGVEQMKGQARLCEMLDRVRLDGETFYTTADNHECNGGAHNSGLSEQSEKSKTGEFLARDIGLFGSPRAARRFMSSNPAIEYGTVKVISFSPLENATFEPDVVVLICNAKQGLKLADAYSYDSGEKAAGWTSAPICSGVVAAPFLTGELTYSFGDSGARRFMKIGDEDVFVGIPAELLPGIVANLEKMAAFRSRSPVGAHA
jgi:uncharacterized protein (DUF169 family)